MLITRLSGPTTDLLDVDTIAQWCRIDPGADALTIKMLMGSAVDYVRGLTGQVLQTGSYRIDLDAPIYPAGSISLSGLFPITAITGITITNSDGTTAPFTSYSANLLQAIPKISPTTVWPASATTISVTVTAGYATANDVPMALRHAVAVMIGAGYDSRADLDPQTLATVSALCSRHRRDWMAA